MPRVGQYEIVRELGRGGMGIVYLAMDPRLDREVALKLLPYEPEPNSPAARRFLREARLASAITHPNIVTIYEVGASERGQFVAMEYVAGESLRARLTNGSVGVAEASRISRQIAEAVAAAQSRGIVHRDIKPENVMLTAGLHVKVLDFGLARRQVVAGSEESSIRTETQITKAHHIVGTLAYMSPEQVSGLPVDTRSDIFSLGVVLYEMLAGRRPFTGPSDAALIGQILHADPEALARFNYAVPPALDLIVRKCLEKEPERRYQSAQELAIDLANLERDTSSGRISSATRAIADQQRQAGSTRRKAAVFWVPALLAVALAFGAWLSWLFWFGGNRSIDSIAVLPFANNTGDRNLTYLSDGLGEAITDDLSRIPGLRVSSQGVVQRYRDRSLDPQTIGRELKVKALLNGDLGRNGNSLSARVELLDVATGARLWGKTYRRPVDDLAGLQQALSTDVAYELPSAIGSSMKRNVAKRYATNSLAYELYLKGRYRLNQRTMDDLNAAASLFEQSAEKDPSFALAYAGLSDAYALIAAHGYQTPAAALEQGKSAALKALELDPGLSEARVSLAIARTLVDFDWEGAEREYRRAIELNPRNGDAHLRYANWLLSPLSRPEEALLEIQRALDLDPANLPANMSQGVILYFARRYEKAIAKFQFIENIQPGFAFARLHLALAYSETDRKRDALPIIEDPTLASKVPVEARCILGVAYAEADRRKDALRIAAGLEREAQHSYVSPYGRALVAAALGEKGRALDLLEESYKVRDPDFIYLNVDPKMDGLRSEKRFRSLLKAGKFL